MSKQYIPKQFTPFVYPEWGELFDDLTPEQSREILLAITKFPEYEPKNVLIWKFIKSQLQKDYENFAAKCVKRGEASRSYWGNKGEQMISNDNKSITSDTKGEPKPLTTNLLPLTINHLPLTETENFYGKYNNVFLSAVNYRKLEVMAMSKKKLQNCIDYLSTSIESGDYKAYDDTMPDKHYEILTTQVKRSFVK